MTFKISPAATAAMTPAPQPRRRSSNASRIKMIKRQMYGRAGFALLRNRVLPGT